MRVFSKQNLEESHSFHRLLASSLDVCFFPHHSVASLSLLVSASFHVILDSFFCLCLSFLIHSGASFPSSYVCSFHNLLSLSHVCYLLFHSPLPDSLHSLSLQGRSSLPRVFSFYPFTVQPFSPLVSSHPIQSKYLPSLLFVPLTFLYLYVPPSRVLAYVPNPSLHTPASTFACPVDVPSPSRAGSHRPGSPLSSTPRLEKLAAVRLCVIIRVGGSIIQGEGVGEGMGVEAKRIGVGGEGVERWRGRLILGEERV